MGSPALSLNPPLFSRVAERSLRHREDIMRVTWWQLFRIDSFWSVASRYSAVNPEAIQGGWTICLCELKLFVFFYYFIIYFFFLHVLFDSNHDVLQCTEINEVVYVFHELWLMLINSIWYWSKNFDGSYEYFYLNSNRNLQPELRTTLVLFKVFKSVCVFISNFFFFFYL